MPELPEVETVRRGLEHALHGATIESVLLRRKDLRTAFPPNLAKTLTGKKIRSIERRAKYLLFRLSSDDVLIAHLGMTGRFLINLTAPKKFGKHDHLVMKLKDGRTLIFNDARRFGLMTVTHAHKIDSHPLLAELGPEPLEKEFSTSYLKSKLSTRRSAIKPVLMDQHLVVGVGNIYASEALFDCGISPKRMACDVADKASAIIKSIHKVLDAAIASGGSSLRDFMNVSGDAGYFQHTFHVYGREGKPCHTCGTKIKAIRQSGRSTFFCPSCQK
jgi:formamidopyrimidine-DNA glycosylase